MSRNSENMENEIQAFTQETFQNFSIDADPEVWSNIQNELQKSKKRAVVWWPYAAAASIAATLGIFFLLNTSPSEEMQLTSNSVKKEELIVNEVAKKEVAEEGIDNSITDTEEKIPTINTIKSKAIVPSNQIIENSKVQSNNNLATKGVNKAPINNNPVTNLKANPVAMMEKDNATSASQPDEDIPLNKVPPIEDSPLIAASSDLILKQDSIIETSPVKEEEKVVITAEDIDKGMPIEENIDPNKKRKKPIFLAANIGTPGSSQNETANFSQTKGFVSIPKPSSNLGIPDADELHNTSDFSERTFSPPIRASVTFNYAFARKWSVESGISYSLLGSRRESKLNEEVQLIQKSYLHYLGIPIMLNFNLITKNKFNSFISLGVGIEKGIRYKTNNQFILNDSSSTYSQKVDGLKYNTNLGLGFEYRFVPLASVYLLPGVQYYNSTLLQPFDVEGSKINGIVPNLRFGLRFHLRNQK